LQLAATLRRSIGDTQSAEGLVKRAGDIPVDDLPLSVSIAAESAATAAAEGRFVDAVANWSVAIQKGSEAGLLADGLSALFRNRGVAFIALDRLAQAEADFARAFDLTRSAHGDDVATFILVDQANHLCDAGQVLVVKAMMGRLEALAARTSSLHLRGELELLFARLSIEDGDLQAAEAHARQARSHALKAVAPVTYFSAGVKLADVLETRGDRLQAYGVLATTWATLSDVIGKDAARSWIEPCLAAYRIKWGEQSFEKAKDEYDAQRRRARSGQESQ
jgi:tetratricopeptide (TPR) repeat protein